MSKYIIYADDEVERTFDAPMDSLAEEIYNELVAEEDNDNVYTSIVLCKLVELKRKEYTNE